MQGNQTGLHHLLSRVRDGPRTSSFSSNPIFRTNSSSSCWSRKPELRSRRAHATKEMIDPV